MQEQTYLLLKPIIFIITILGIFNNCYAQTTSQRAKDNEAEIQRIKKENKIIHSYIDSISQNVSEQEQLLKTKIDAFDKELAYYKVNQSHFTTAIKLETAVFTTIVTTVFFLLGVFSFFNYNSTFNKIESSTNKKLLEQKSTFEESQMVLNDIVEQQVDKQKTIFEKVKTEIDNKIEKQLSGQKSSFKILKQEIELGSQSSLSQEIAKHEQAFQKLIGEISVDITKQIEKQKAEFEGVKSNMETKVGFLLGSQIENFKEQKEKIDANLDLELLNYKKELNDFKDKMIVLELSLLGTSANSYMTITHDFFKKKNWINALDFSLSATNCHFKRILIKEENPKFVILGLKRALKALEEIEKNTLLKSKVKNLYNTQWKEKINSFATSNHDEVQNLVSELRMRINNYTIE